MPPEIAQLHQTPVADAPHLFVLPPKLEVSPETRRMLMAIIAEADAEEDEALEPAPIADLAAFRARKRG